jgi:PAS domain-containing protein
MSSTIQPSDETRTQALGAFLRAHRERLSPQAVGLAVSGRRRTPGLRREELAQLCAVSTTWYTWLEQGRPVKASLAAWSRIADALRLSRAERLYLFELAQSPGPDSLAEPASEVPVELKYLVDHMAIPAYVLDRQWNAVAWNRRAAALFRPWLLEPADRNLLRFVFLHRAARSLIVDWNRRAARLVAEFRSDAARHITEPPTLRLIHDLQQRSRWFAKFWDEQDVKEREGGNRVFRNSDGGQSSYRQLSMIPSSNSDLKLVTLIPQVKRRRGA